MFLNEYFRWQLTRLFHTIYIEEAALLANGNSFFSLPHSTLSLMRTKRVCNCGGVHVLRGIDIAGQRNTGC